MIIFLISHHTHNVVTPHLNYLAETVQMRGHNICRINKNYPLLSRGLTGSALLAYMVP